MGRGDGGRERIEGEEREVGEDWGERGKERGWGDHNYELLHWIRGTGAKLCLEGTVLQG